MTAPTHASPAAAALWPRRGVESIDIQRAACQRLWDLDPITEAALLELLPDLLPFASDILAAAVAGYRAHDDKLLLMLIRTAADRAFDLAVSLQAGRLILRADWHAVSGYLVDGMAAARVWYERHPGGGEGA